MVRHRQGADQHLQWAPSTNLGPAFVSLPDRKEPLPRRLFTLTSPSCTCSLFPSSCSDCPACLLLADTLHSLIPSLLRVVPVFPPHHHHHHREEHRQTKFYTRDDPNNQFFYERGISRAAGVAAAARYSYRQLTGGVGNKLFSSYNTLIPRYFTDSLNWADTSCWPVSAASRLPSQLKTPQNTVQQTQTNGVVVPTPQLTLRPRAT